jgi:hypothetical protein
VFQLLGQLFVGAGCGAGNFSSAGSNCGRNSGPDVSGHLLLGVVLASAGFPLIVLGAERVRAQPQNTATMSPWVGQRSAGLSLRLGL